MVNLSLRPGPLHKTDLDRASSCSPIRQPPIPQSSSSMMSSSSDERPNYGAMSMERSDSIASMIPAKPPSRAVPFKYDHEELTTTQKLAYYFPCYSWMATYTFNDFVHDVLAGLSLASYQIPLSMSFATVLAHVPAICGLVGLTVAPIVYLLLGTVPQIVVGPEAAVSLIVGQCIEKTIKHHPDVNPVDLVVVLGSCSGLILIVFSFCHLGFIDSILCGSLLKAFICSIGITMLIGATAAITGIDKVMAKLPPDVHIHTPFKKLCFLLENLDQYNKATTIVGLGTFAACLILGEIKKMCIKRRVKFASFFPEILVVVIFCTVLSAEFDFEHRGIDVIGKISLRGTKYKVPFSPSLGNWYSELFTVSLVCAILGFFESASAARSLSEADAPPMASNKELFALGAVGIGVSSFGALPSFGGYARSKLNWVNGGKTPVSAAIMGLTTLLVMTFLLDFIYYLPISALNGVVGIIGVSLLSEAPAELAYHIRTKGYHEILTFFVTTIAAFFSTVEVGVGLGTFYSLMRAIKHSTQSRIQILAREQDTDYFINSEFADPKTPAPLLNDEHFIIPGYKESKSQPLFQGTSPKLEDREGCLIVKIPEPLTFTNANDLKTRLRRVELYGSTHSHQATPQTADAPRHIIFNMHGMTSMDSSASQILLGIVRNYCKRNINVFFTKVYRKGSLLERLQDSGINDLLISCGDGEQYGVHQRFKPYYDSILDALKVIDCMESRGTYPCLEESALSSIYETTGV